MILDEKKTFAFFIISALILSSSILVLRQLFYDGIIPGHMPYYHMSSAEDLATKGEQGYIFSPYHNILAAAGRHLGVDTASKIIPLIFGLLSSIIFYLIIKESKADTKERFLIMMMLVFSPAFIYLCSFSNQHSIPVFLTLLGIYLLPKKNVFLSILCFVSFALAIPFSIFNSVLVVSIIVAYIISEVRKCKSLKIKEIPPGLSKAGIFLLLFFVISILSFPFYFNQKTNIIRMKAYSLKLSQTSGLAMV